MSACRNAPAAGDNRGADQKNNPAGLQGHSTPPAELLLSRLEHAKAYGEGWRAKCPAHSGQSNASLSIAIGDDGRALIHCFGGCAAIDVMHAVGLELSDLFPERITHTTTPAERRRLRELARQSQWKAALASLAFESQVVLAAADQVGAGENLNCEDAKRLTVAVDRIQEARKVLCGRQD